MAPTKLEAVDEAVFAVSRVLVVVAIALAWKRQVGVKEELVLV